MTNRPNFTPGPWHVFDKTKVEAGKDFVADCECMGVYFERSVDEANAAFIAAAPEMYEALEKVVEYGDCFAHKIGERAPYQMVMDALKKARGEE